MADIIAHPGRPSRFPRRAGRQLWSRLASAMGCDCPLCGARVGRAPVRGCEADVTRSCREPGARCRAARSAAPAPLCAGCLSRPPAYLRAIVAFDYEPPGVALIGQLKTRLRLSLAPVLARLLGRPSPGRHPACRCGAGRRTGQPGLAASARHEPGHGDRPQPGDRAGSAAAAGRAAALRETPRRRGWGARRAALAGVPGRARPAWRWWTT